ncbi:hypothetical protein BDN72DRAFT_900422 [Pluteus cervinus]|uniref:Uncharacterized protein n=1 Tax=Pluteus cervinus TaxID=181527 RepID=A0ACD3AJA8_9AGAR|nr:hypothetical protein BDN72DRAFT_900422 [Pluteus cervinus]
MSEASDPDPFARFTRSAQGEEPGASTSNPPGGIDGDDDNQSDHGLSGNSPAEGTPSGGLHAFAHLVKKQKKLDSAAINELNIYCSTIDVEERMLLTHATLLEIRSELREQRHKEELSFSVPEALKEHIRLYVKAFLYSPTIKSYKGNGAEHILRALRELSVPNLPSENQPLQVSAVISVISDELTSIRNFIKTKIKESVVPGSEMRNIADLTHTLLSGASIRPTLQHYIRFAFLREHVVTHTVGDFWTAVDRVISDWAKKATTTAELTGYYNNCYQDDKKLYGDPAMSIHQPGDTSVVEEWRKTVDRHAAAIQSGSGRKRKRGGSA